MKNKLIYLLSFLGAIMVYSCSEDIPGYEAGPNQNEQSTNVSFSKANSKSLVLPLEATSFDIVLNRENNVSAQTVSLKVEDAFQGDVFEIPSTVTFEAGSSSAAIEIKLKSIELMVKYHIALEVEVDQTKPYLAQDVYPRIEMDVLQEDFAPFAEGNYTSEFFEDTWSAVLEYSPATSVYRFSDCWMPGYDVTFQWTGTEVTMLGTTNGAFKVFPTGYVHPTYGMVSAFFAEGCSFDEGTQTFTFPINWRVKAGSFGDYPDQYVITQKK